MSKAVLNTLCILTYLTFITTLWGRNQNYFHFTDKETENLDNLLTLKPIPLQPLHYWKTHWLEENMIDHLAHCIVPRLKIIELKFWKWPKYQLFHFLHCLDEETSSPMDDISEKLHRGSFKARNNRVWIQVIFFPLLQLVNRKIIGKSANSTQR